MIQSLKDRRPTRQATIVYAANVFGLMLVIMFSVSGGIALAAPSAATAPGLGAAASFSALGKAGVTNTGPSALSGKVGADSSITGFPPGSSGEVVIAPAVNGAEADASTADLALTAQSSSAASAGPNLTGVSLVPGVYSVGAALLTGELTLNGPGVYIFLASALTSSGSVNLINGATACSVFWHVTSGAAITGGSFVGTIIAGTSVTFGDASHLDGRALALTGNVTLINTTISGPSCAVSSTATAASTTKTPIVLTATIAANATAVPVAPIMTATVGAALLPVTGADMSDHSSLALRQLMQTTLVFLGIGLVLVGYVLTRKRNK